MSDATSLHHCLKNKQLKLNAFSGKDPAKGVFHIMRTYEGCGYYLHMTDHTPMQLEKDYTCYIERRWHTHYKPVSARLAKGLLVFNA